MLDGEQNADLGGEGGEEYLAGAGVGGDDVEDGVDEKVDVEGGGRHTSGEGFVDAWVFCCKVSLCENFGLLEMRKW